MNRLVYLHGRLRKKFPGGPFPLYVGTVQEIIRALSANFPGFRAEIAKGAYRIIVGSKKTGDVLTEDLLTFGLTVGKPVHIIPTVTGRGGNGIFTTILGIALIAVATVATAGGFGAVAAAGVFGTGLSWGTVGLMGAALTFGGIAQLLTPTPKTPNMGEYERPEDKPSFLLGGTVNTTLQGNPIPIVGGRILCGSLVISAGLYTEKMPT